jgi:glycosyltransferase involved in cell wall biosynthesis
VIEPKDILFVGLGKSAVMWYRCALPALHMGCDWVGVVGKPPQLHVATGLVKRQTTLPNYEDYKVVIIQQPSGQQWLKVIRRLQEDHGITVLYEIDDYLHGVRKQEDHDFKTHFDKHHLRGVELCMRVCDGVIASTDWLGRKYRAFNKKVWVAENGVDIARYRLTKPERETVTIGWAGATGHVLSMTPWLNAVLTVMQEHDHVNFAAIGMPGFAAPFEQVFGKERALGVPWTLIENYPGAMTMMDIAIAPAGKSAWFRGKSDLRWLEAGALGIPIVADPDTYPRIEHGVNGFHATTPEEVVIALRQLIRDPDLRRTVGEAARSYVVAERDISKTCARWLEIAREASAGGQDSVVPLRSGARS